ITQREMVDAQNEVRLYYRLRFQQFPSTQEIPTSEIYTRVLLARKLQEMNINIPPEATARWIRDLFQRGGAQGNINEQYQQFVKTQLEPNGLRASDFERFARNEVGQQHLMSVFGMSGSLLPRAEAESLYRRENEQFRVEAVFFSASNFVDQVKVDEEALARYFQLNQPNYRIPDRIQVDYVLFATSNYLNAAQQQFAADTNANLFLERTYFERGGTNAFRDPQGNPLTFEQARPQLQEEYIERLALMEARKAGAAFINAVDEYRKQNPAATDAVAQVAQAQNLPVQTSPLIHPGTDFTELNLPFGFRSAAFRLSRQEPFTTSPVLSEEGAYVLGLRQEVPGQIPEFAAVKEQVAQDYRMAEAVKLARNAGEQFAQNLQTGLTEGRSFESILIGSKAQSVTLPQFSLATQSMPELQGRLTLDRLQSTAARLSPGQASDFLSTENGGAILFLRERTEVDPQKLAGEIDQYIARAREQQQYVAYMTWLNNLAEEMQLRMPVEQQPRAQR
ncbi:MAG: hypothetical protein ACK4UN_08795, partial [Limisphaerales bacterium]